MKNPVISTRNKPIDLKYHYVKERYESEEMGVTHVPSALMQAGLLTKPLPRETFERLRTSMGMDVSVFDDTDDFVNEMNEYHDFGTSDVSCDGLSPRGGSIEII